VVEPNHSSTARRANPARRCASAAVRPSTARRRTTRGSPRTAAACAVRAGRAAAAGDDRRDDLLGEPAGDLVEDRDGELFDRLKALVEVALGQAGLVADLADARRRDAAGSEQLESGIQELLAADGQPLAGADAAVRA
jgi:hypothetical protein